MLTEPRARFSDIIPKILYNTHFLVKSAASLKCLALILCVLCVYCVFYRMLCKALAKQNFHDPSEVSPDFKWIF